MQHFTNFLPIFTGENCLISIFFNIFLKIHHFTIFVILLMKSRFQFFASFFSHHFTTVADSFCKIYHLTFMFQLSPIIFDFYYSSTWYLLTNFWLCFKCILFILLLLLSAVFALQLLFFNPNISFRYFYNSLCKIQFSIFTFC